MNDTKNGLIAFAFSIVPYAAAAWSYTYFTGGHSREFWIAMGILLAARLFFFIIETFGGVLAWRLLYKRRMVEQILAVFRANKFPPNQRVGRSVSNYLSRILEDYEPKPDYVGAAKDLESLALLYENEGILPGMRFNVALEAAFKIYESTPTESDSVDAEDEDEDE